MLNHFTLWHKKLEIAFKSDFSKIHSSKENMVLDNKSRCTLSKAGLFLLNPFQWIEHTIILSNKRLSLNWKLYKLERILGRFPLKKWLSGSLITRLITKKGAEWERKVREKKKGKSKRIRKEKKRSKIKRCYFVMRWGLIYFSPFLHSKKCFYPSSHRG